MALARRSPLGVWGKPAPRHRRWSLTRGVVTPRGHPRTALSCHRYGWSRHCRPHLLALSLGAVPARVPDCLPSCFTSSCAGGPLRGCASAGEAGTGHRDHPAACRIQIDSATTGLAGAGAVALSSETIKVSSWPARLAVFRLAHHERALRSGHQAASRISRSSSSTRRNRGSGAMHMVRYVSRKASHEIHQTPAEHLPESWPDC